MRLQVAMQMERPAVIPVNHQDLLTALVYRLVGSSDAAYARFLHDEGYALDDGPRRFKLFAFSGLRSKLRKVEGGRLTLGPGRVDWFLSSPVSDFLTHCATGLLAAGALQVGAVRFPIESIETLPAPDFTSGRLDGVCLTPILATASRPAEQGPHAEHVRPAEGAAFSKLVYHNLLHKYQVLFGRPPEGEPVTLSFNQEYMARHRGGTKKITFKGIDFVGALAPFTAAGDPALLRVGYDCGFGEKNSAGFGMVEVGRKERGRQ